MILQTARGDVWRVVKTQEGRPVSVEHIFPWMRGSFLQASMNAGLAVWNFKHALREALPAVIRRHVPEPARWWVEGTA